MRLKDPTEWFDDLSFYIEDKELLDQAAALEPTLIHGGSRIAAAVWIILVSAIAGAFGGFTFSSEVRSSWSIFLPYLAGGAVLLRFINPLSKRLVGPTFAWQALQAFFWSFMLAMTAVLTARIDTLWLFYVASIGGGLFIGLMYGSLGPGIVAREDAWLLTALPLGPLATWTAASVQQGFDASLNAPWSEAFVGLMAATVFMVPMAVQLAVLSTKANGLAKMATLYLHNDNFTSKAIEYLDQAIALSPRSVEFYNLRGIAYSKAGNGDRADIDFKKVSELSPRAAEAHMNRGVDFMRQGDYERSIDALKHAITVNPKFATAFSNLGTAYQKKGDLDLAIESYSRAIQIRPKYPIAFSNRAYSHYLKGEHDLAIADATHAITLDDRLPVAHVNLGHALAGKGDAGMAARSFRRGLALKPDETVEEEALQALQKLGVSADHRDDEDDEDE